MSEHHVPAGKLCPFISTAQVLISEIAFQAQVQKGMSLAGIQGASMASAPDMTTGKGVVVHKDPVLPEGFDPNAGKALDISQIKTFTAQPISVPCVRDKCQGWDDAVSDCGYKSRSALATGAHSNQEKSA
jgi:hypothetical protein